MKYENVDIINSRVNLFTVKDECNSFIEYVQNKFLNEIDNNIWKSSSKDKLISGLNVLLEELNDLYSSNENAITALSDIEEIKKLESINKQLKEENKRYEISGNPTDQLKIVANNEKINQNEEKILMLELKIRKDWE